MKRSTDGGRTWSDRLPVPENWATSKETPTIHRVVDAAGKKRLIVWSGLHPARLAVSEDDGQSWSPLKPAGDWGGIVVMGFVEARSKPGHYFAMFHDDGRFFRTNSKPENPVVFTLYQTESMDGGLTWSEPLAVYRSSDLHLCEPGLIRSPDGRQMAILLRENSRRKNSHIMFSEDEGQTWSEPRELPKSLTGDRHTGKYAPDGRLFISFRDMAAESATKGDWVAWVGKYEDLKQGREGQYHVRLMDNRNAWDCAYPGVEVLPDGTIVTTTYGHWTEGEQPYVVSVRLKVAELDQKAGTAKAESTYGQPDRKLKAQTFNSGFALAHDTYNGMGVGSDGNVYYVLSSESIDVGAQMYRFDTKKRAIQHLGDLTEACGEKGLKAIPQGKSHVNFVEADGKLYFSTHIGVYSIIDGMEKMGIPPEGYQAYPGGHLMAFDLKSGEFQKLATAPEHEGVLTMNMDPAHGRIFAITWPSGLFFRYNLAEGSLKNFGKTCAEGENGKGADYRTICRSIAVDPSTGRAWYSTSEGDIFLYDPERDSVRKLTGDDLKKDYFGIYDPTSPGHMGYNWRQTAWHAPQNMIYGVHGNSGYLFRFDPDAERVELLERLTSERSKRSGMFDQFSYGYLGFALGPDGRTLHYLTGAPIYLNGKRLAGKSSTAMGEAKGLEDLHLITYDLEAGNYQDHGAIFYENGDRPLYVNSIAVAPNANVYFLARITENGKTRTDLVEVQR